ncbi:hypothetical protein BH23BAC4_BH23BAC4_04510 [soil metagenome]
MTWEAGMTLKARMTWKAGITCEAGRRGPGSVVPDYVHIGAGSDPGVKVPRYRILLEDW